MKRQLADPKRSVRAAPLSRTISANPRAATNSRSVPSYTSSLVPFQAPLIPVCLTSTGTIFAGHSNSEPQLSDGIAWVTAADGGRKATVKLEDQITAASHMQTDTKRTVAPHQTAQASRFK